MNAMITDEELKLLADRYVAQWNEADADRRQASIRELWAPDARQVLVNPPQAIRDSAAELGIVAPPLEVSGYDALDARVGRAYEMFVAAGEFTFELDGQARRQPGDTVTLAWVMRSRADGTAAAGGLEVLTFDADGRIRTDHQFVA
ncbi:hypothetical protein [Nocardia pseudobrasiliensis]|uniref:SnoaL-like protein n=1 Tax=Nocardia pseudobrasiliensis TaxID=45979 RepID=A0A370HWR9_9NOCA|nr:hypothetical protein [Nocardia pseudobrasiliensis]RDI62942.1 hypothetical protein DFR76_112261 [Nocardia pseudobrasiliensis]